MGFAELSITSNFTFLTGGSHPEEYARRAALLGLSAIAIADATNLDFHLRSTPCSVGDHNIYIYPQRISL